MINSADISGSLALDVQTVDNLRLQAKKDPDAALKAAARQFESLLVNMMLKSMREATESGGLFDSEEHKLYTSMLDQQVAQGLGAKGIGLADIMVKQLAQAKVAAQVNGVPASPGSAPPSPAQPVGEMRLPATGREFINRLWPHAAEASQATGIPAQFILGQAALESGWGKRELRASDGTQSFNLFGIKAGRGWSGPVAEAVTTEYVNGVSQKTVEKFRAYRSYAEGFKDYANLLLNNSRYAAVLEQGRDAASFANGLQQAGYATDPLYADKLTRILNSSGLRQGLAG